MKIRDEPVKFLFKKFGISTSDDMCCFFPFRHFLGCILKRKDSFVNVAVKQAYDEYVRDILVEKRISFRKRSYYSTLGTHKVKLGKWCCIQ